MAKGKLKVCNNGHEFFKSSDCPVCPICEKERKPDESFLSLLSAPARRALESQGIKKLTDLKKFTEQQLLSLHGMGPSGVKRLKTVLRDSQMNFKKG